METPPTRAWDRLIRQEYVHGSLYTDEAIFREELEKIWYRTWVYVGHVSEIPQPNDYVLKTIGLEEIIMTRDRDGQVHLLHNRCPHRGNRVCVKHQGNARSFTCAYHGWNFGNDGQLKGYPYPSGYPDDKRKELGLGQVAGFEAMEVAIAAARTHGVRAAEPVLVKRLVRPALRRRLGDQLRRMPAQLNLHTGLALGQLAACGVQVRFANPAPGADQVEIDINLHRGAWDDGHQAALRKKPWLPPLRLGEKPLAASDSSTVS